MRDALSQTNFYTVVSIKVQTGDLVEVIVLNQVLNCLRYILQQLPSTHSVLLIASTEARARSSAFIACVRSVKVRYKFSIEKTWSAKKVKDDHTCRTCFFLHAAPDDMIFCADSSSIHSFSYCVFSSRRTPEIYLVSFGDTRSVNRKRFCHVQAHVVISCHICDQLAHQHPFCWCVTFFEILFWEKSEVL